MEYTFFFGFKFFPISILLVFQYAMVFFLFFLCDFFSVEEIEKKRTCGTHLFISFAWHHFATIPLDCVYANKWNAAQEEEKTTTAKSELVKWTKKF